MSNENQDKISAWIIAIDLFVIFMLLFQAQSCYRDEHLPQVVKDLFLSIFGAVFIFEVITTHLDMKKFDND